MKDRKQEDEHEFHLQITPVFDELLKKDGLLFHLETSKQFQSFKYEIAVVESIRENEIVWDIQGLRPPAILLKSFGAAVFEKIYHDLRGKYYFMLTKGGGEPLRFSIAVGEKTVTANRIPSTKLASVLLPAHAREKKKELKKNSAVPAKKTKRTTKK